MTPRHPRGPYLPLLHATAFSSSSSSSSTAPTFVISALLKYDENARVHAQILRNQSARIQLFIRIFVVDFFFFE